MIDLVKVNEIKLNYSQGKNYIIVDFLLSVHMSWCVWIGGEFFFFVTFTWAN